jgi:hypothetical protein
VAQVQEVWNKLNPRERLTASGALVVMLGWILSIAGYGAGAGTVSLLGAIAVLAILYLKYTPNQNITWPAPIPTIILAISAIVALLAALDVLTSLNFLRIFGFGLGIIALIVEAIGAALMVWGAWQEYQLTRPASTSTPVGTTTPPPTTTPTTPPPTTPPAPSDTEDLPPV